MSYVDELSKLNDEVYFAEIEKRKLEIKIRETEYKIKAMKIRHSCQSFYEVQYELHKNINIHLLFTSVEKREYYIDNLRRKPDTFIRRTISIDKFSNDQLKMVDTEKCCCNIDIDDHSK